MIFNTTDGKYQYYVLATTSWASLDTGTASGTVTSVSVVTANGISGTVANATSTPAITLSLGDITPTTVNGLTLAAAATGFTIAGGTTSKTLTVPLDASVSGTNTGDQTLSSLGAQAALVNSAGLSTAIGGDVAVVDGGTGLSAIADGSVLAANAENVLSAITWHSAGTKVLTNIDGTIGWGAPAAGYTDITQFVDQTAWRSFYSDGSGDIKELAFGDAAKVLTSNGANAAPTWETAGGGISAELAIAYALSL